MGDTVESALATTALGSTEEACCSSLSMAATAWAARKTTFEDRLANLAAQSRFLSAHREHGTLLSQPVFACAQFKQAMGVLPAMVGTPPGPGSNGSRASWYVE